MRSLPAATLLLLFLAAPTQAAQAQAWVVDVAGGGDFLQVQLAVDAAAEGDVIVVRDGIYPGFDVAGKGVRVVAEVGNFPVFDGEVQVRDLALQQNVALTGLEVLAQVEISNCQGQVLLDDFRVVPQGWQVGGPLGNGCAIDPGLVVVTDARDVLMNDCVILGRDGKPTTGDGLPGETAVLSRGSRVSLSRSHLAGGRGSNGASSAMGCDFYWSGHGGSALALDLGSVGYVNDCTLIPGAGGYRDCTNACDGRSIFLSLDSKALAVATPHLTLDHPRTVTDEGTVVFELVGEPGAGAFLLLSAAPTHRFLGSGVGILHLIPTGVTPLGTFDGSGQLQFIRPMGELPPGVEAAIGVAQVLVVSSPTRYLSHPTSLTVIDADL